MEDPNMSRARTGLSQFWRLWARTLTDTSKYAFSTCAHPKYERSRLINLDLSVIIFRFQEQRWLFCGISHSTKKIPIPWDFFKKVWDKYPKKSHVIEKSRDFREIPKNPKNVQPEIFLGFYSKKIKIDLYYFGFLIFFSLKFWIVSNREWFEISFLDFVIPLEKNPNPKKSPDFPYGIFLGKKSLKSRDLGYEIWYPRKIPSQSHLWSQPSAKNPIANVIFPSQFENWDPHSLCFFYFILGSCQKSPNHGNFSSQFGIPENLFPRLPLVSIFNHMN